MNSKTNTSRTSTSRTSTSRTSKTRCPTKKSPKNTSRCKPAIQKRSSRAKTATLSVARIKATQIKKSDVAYPQGQVYQDVIVPSTEAKSKPISTARFNARVDEVKRFFSGIFGGYTSIGTVGGWVSEGTVIREKGVKVVSFSPKSAWTVTNQRKVIRFLREKCYEWEQEAVAYRIEDDLFFLKPLKTPASAKK